MNKNRFLLIGAMGLTLGMTSCIDDNYDLDDIDMNLGIKTDLTLPTSSLGNILLKNVMDLKEDGVVQLVDNPLKPGEKMYVVKQSGEPDIAPIQINTICIKAPKIKDINSTVKLNIALPTNTAKRVAGRKHLPISINGMDLNIQDVTYTYQIQAEDNARQELLGAEATGISTDVVAIDSIKFGEVKITLAISTDFPSHFPYMHLDDLTLTLPEDLHVKSCKLNGREALKITPGKITITGSKGSASDQKLSTRNILLEMVVDKASMGKDLVFDGEKHTASLGGTFDVGGTFRIETSELDGDAISRIIESKWYEILDKINPLNPQLNLSDVSDVIPESITFTGSTRFSDDIRLEKVSGEFQHEIGRIAPIALNDLPDFLDDEEVVLDLDNPMVFLSIENPLPADIHTSLTLKSETDKDAAGNPIPRTTGSLVIKGNQTNDYYLAAKEENRYLPQEHKQAEWKEVVGLPNLIKQIPDEIEVETETVTLKAEDLDITQSYPIHITYDVYAPLVFGEQFKLVYKGTEDVDLDDELEDVNAEDISVKANISSSLPARIHLELELLNEENQKIDIIEDNSITVEAGGERVPIELGIKAKKGHTINEIFREGRYKLNAIRYKAVLDKPKAGEPLQDNAHIKMDDIQITIKGTVTIDAN